MRLVGTAASGLRAQQIAIDTIGNNIANVNTTGFKSNQMNFAEALSSEVRSANTNTDENTGAATVGVGAGVIYSASGTNFKQGTLAPSERPLDLGISGSGFFQVETPEGKLCYTRAGAFQVDGSGQLADMKGNIVLPSISIPLDAKEVTVGTNGDITGVIDGESIIFGQIVLAGFQNPEGLQRIENNLYEATVNSGQPLVGQPGSVGEDGNQILGTIRSQSLEQSNVDLAVSMTDLMQVQKAYQMNARLIQDGDKMWGIANAMRR